MNAEHLNCPDFKPLVINKKNNKVITKSSGGYIQSHQAKIEKAIDEGIYKPQKYDTEFIQKMIRFRTGKGWNQQMFAQQVHLQLPIIRGIESNTLAYNSGYVNKINNFMNR